MNEPPIKSLAMAERIRQMIRERMAAKEGETR